MAYYHHGTIRKYTSSLLSTFNDIEIQYKNSSGSVISKNIPLTYSSKEKSVILDNKSIDLLLSGNYNILPRASLSLDTMTRVDSRITNKNNKINTFKDENTIEYSYNSVPYEFTYVLTFLCRGMNEATQIIEQVAPLFNPTINIDIWDATNLNEPTRIPIRLTDISFESQEYDELSSNIVTVVFNLSLVGNLHQPIRSIYRIKELKMSLNKINDETAKRSVIKEWDVSEITKLPVNEESEQLEEINAVPEIIDIVVDNFILGNSNFTVIYNDNDNLLTDLSFAWEILSPLSASISADLDKAVVTATESGDYEIQVTITDLRGNYNTLSKIFTI